MYVFFELVKTSKNSPKLGDMRVNYRLKQHATINPLF